MNKKIVTLGIVLTILAFTFTPTVATFTTVAQDLGCTLFVSPAGSDTNSGSITLPYKTITKAIGAAVAGSVICVRAGNYPTFDVPSAKSDLTLSAYPGETVVLSGGVGVGLRGNRITLKGFSVTNAGSDWGAAIMSYGHENVICDNEIYSNVASGTTSGIMLYFSYGNIVCNNKIHDNAMRGVWVYGGASDNNTVDGNEVYSHTLSTGNSDGVGCTVGSTGNVFSNNLIYGNSDDGLDTWDCPANIVIGNTSHNNGGTGDGNCYKLGGPGGGGNTVTGNVAYSCETMGFTSNGKGDFYLNNIAHNNGKWGFDDGWRTDGSVQVSTFEGNAAYKNLAGQFSLGQYSVLLSGNTTATPMAATPTIAPSATAQVSIPIFTDDFDGTSLDLSKWAPANKRGYGQEVFVPSNVSVSNGLLHLRADSNFNSGEVDSRNKFTVQYGYVEASIRVPKGNGYWPAFWVLTNFDNTSPFSRQEIDIMESKGGDIHQTAFNVHWGTSGSSPTIGGFYSDPSIDYSADFHKYAANWSPTEIKFYVDDILRWTWAQPIPPAVFDPSHVLISLSICATNSFCLAPDSNTIWPGIMDIDYIRVYSLGSIPTSTPLLPQTATQTPAVTASQTASGVPPLTATAQTGINTPTRTITPSRTPTLTRTVTPTPTTCLTRLPNGKCKK